MAKYFLHDGDLIEIFLPNGIDYSSAGAFCTHDIQTLADDWNTNDEDHPPLIDVEFYPIPVKVAAFQIQDPPQISFREYICCHQEELPAFHTLTTPPPRPAQTWPLRFNTIINTI